jgi:hypothetical protein
MTDQVQEVQAAKPVEKVAIINGRMPVAVVAMARFGNTKGEATKTLATLFGTTVGKIDDIKKNRNFAYVTADFKPTEAQRDEGLAWLKRHPNYDASGVDKLVVELENWPLASAEEATAFDAERSKGRGQPTVTKDGQVADGGGGNRRKPRNGKGKEPVVEGGTDADVTGDALLA